MTSPCLTPSELLSTLDGFVERLEADEAHLNAINVFPVADGDTGTNMVRTARPLVAAAHHGLVECGGSESRGPDSEASRAVGAAFGRAALDASRGNSGLILAQYLVGFVAEVLATDLAGAFRAGAERARRAVAEPVEGTMLTVAEAAADAAGEGAASGLGRGSFMEAVVDQVGQAVAATPAQLPVLAEHGVVDAGAAGLALFVDALADALGVTPAGRPVLSSATPSARPAATEGSTFVELQFTAVMDEVGAAGMRALLADRGDDVVVSSASGTIRAHVHLHLDQLGGTIEAVLGVTRPSNLSIEAIPARPERLDTEGEKAP
ncbi:MAG: DAK2 domain-containing protein [Actinomycetota bacterium]